MGILNGAWEAIRFIVRLGDKVERLNERAQSQQKMIEMLSERVLRLELLLQLSAGAYHHLLTFKDQKPP